MTKKSGLFITFEGPEGSGKSTHIKLLKEYLDSKGLEVEVYREPGSTDIGERIRDILLDVNSKRMSSCCELYLYLASRAQLIEEEIKPALKSSKVVLCDRFHDATLAYQIYASNMPHSAVAGFEEVVLKGVKPQITFYLDLEAADGLRRAASVNKKQDRLEAKGIDYHRRVRAGYLELARKHPERIRTLDASKSIEDVQAQIRKIIDEFFS